MSTWILLRGLMREARHWGDFPAHFQASLHAQTLLTPTFPGNGQLCHLPSAAGIPAMLDFLRADLLRQGHPPPYNLLAISLGAMAAVAWAQSQPQEIGRMVLINTSLRPFNRFYQRLRPHNYLSLLAMLGRDNAEREEFILRLTSNLAPNRADFPFLLANWQRWAAECPVSRANILRQLQAAIRFRAAPEAPSVPTLLLAAQQDRLVSCACSQILAKRWQLPLHLHPEAGHDLPLDDAGWVCEKIAGWIPD